MRYLKRTSGVSEHSALINAVQRGGDRDNAVMIADGLELEKRIKEYCTQRRASYTKLSESFYKIVEGTMFTSCADMVKVVFSVKMADGNVEITKRSYHMLLDKRPVEIIAAAREEALREYLAASRSAPSRIDSRYDNSLDYISTIFTRTASSCFLNFCALLVWFSACLYIVFSDLKAQALSRGLLVTQLGGLPLPSIRELSEFTRLDVLNCSLLFSGLPALLMSALFSAASLAMRTSARLGFAGMFVFIFTSFFYLISLFKINALSALLIAVGGPLLSMSIQRFVWLSGQIAVQKTSPAVKGAAVLFVISMMVVPVPSVSLKSEDISSGFLGIRDGVVLANGMTRWLGDWYYKYTLYAAEIKKPLFSFGDRAAPTRQVLILLYGSCPALEQVLSRRGVYVRKTRTLDEFMTESSRRGYDLVIATRQSVAPARRSDNFIVMDEKATEADTIAILNDTNDRLYKASGFGELDASSKAVAFLTVPFLIIATCTSLIIWCVKRLSQGRTLLTAAVAVTLAFAVGLALLFRARLGGAEPASAQDIARIVRQESVTYNDLKAVNSAIMADSNIKIDEAVIDRWLGSGDPRVIYWSCLITANLHLTHKFEDLLPLLESNSIIIRYQAARFISAFLEHIHAYKNVPISNEQISIVKEKLRKAVESDVWYVGANAYNGLVRLERWVSG